MAHDPRLFERVLDALARKDGWKQQSRFGVPVCVRNGHAFIGALEDGVIALCDAETRSRHLQMRHCSPFLVKGVEQPGWVKVDREALKTAKQLGRWVEASYIHAGAIAAPGPKRVKPAPARRARKAAARPATRARKK